MTHDPIHINNISFTFSHKTCFENFSTQILPFSRIAIIGRNGSGKSSLLKMLAREMDPTTGSIRLPDKKLIAYVPQLLSNEMNLSGAQCFHQYLSAALATHPAILLLDEPTNHLDSKNRRSLMRMLQYYAGTLIVVTHDTELLQAHVDTLWHIDQEQIHIFSGSYADYQHETQLKRHAIENELSILTQQKKAMHDALMQEQVRAAKSRKKGEKSISQRKWPTITSHTKALHAQETSGKKKLAIENKKQELSERLHALKLPEIIKPNFHLSSEYIHKQNLISISAGSIAYAENFILSDIYLNINYADRVAILGDNASGKSTLIKAILNDPKIIKHGDWHIPPLQQIGYLDQHYQNLQQELTVLDSIESIVPHWHITDIRRHLSDFLFRQNEEVSTRIKYLSGGEKARLSLAQIAAATPALLILDEITNNLDLETKEHVTQVLRDYPGALLVISHDSTFLKEINIENYYQIKEGKLSCQPTMT